VLDALVLADETRAGDRPLVGGLPAADWITAVEFFAERLDELAEILAAGLLRLKANKSSGLSAATGESSLDCAARQSGHANALKRPGGLD
jgi:hypothetical protein